MGQLDGRTALVTGATSGIGLAAATRLAEAGATVVLTGRSQERLDAAVTQVAARAGGGEVIGVRGDVSSDADLDGCSTSSPIAARASTSCTSTPGAGSSAPSPTSPGSTSRRASTATSPAPSSRCRRHSAS